MGRHISTEQASTQVEIFDTVEALAQGIAGKLLTVLRQTVETDGIAHVSLTGGSAGIKTLRAAAVLLRQDAAPTPDFSAVHFWWGDERLLPTDDPQRNETQAHAALLDQLVADHGLPSENIHPMPCSEEAANPEAGAQMYAQDLAKFGPQGGVNGVAMPPLAVMLLGVGPDGHINSLFPGKDALRVSGQATTGEDDAPAQLGPPMRVTMTFDAIHSARRVWMGVAGQDKAPAAAQALAADADVAQVPAADARGAEETIWHMDRAAAAELS